MLLACLGIHGLLSFVVASRTQEIGVRMAFGATPGHGAGPGARAHGGAGRPSASTVGLGAAFAVSRSLQALLAGVSPADGPTFAGAALLAFVVALTGSLLPTRRAMRVDPLAAIRTE